MVSGHAPIKAKKLRYYLDANFKQRVLPPPVLADGGYADVPPARRDDWSGLAIPTVLTTAATVSVVGVGSADDGGPRQQPELSDAATYNPEPEYPASDLSLLDDDVPPLFHSQLDPTLQRTARLVSLDPDDGIQL
jgi:type IV secretion system protein VirD4